MSERKIKGFHEMNLDDRLLKAIAKLGWCEPTLIQERVIPLIIEGKDVLIRARTGSGKTGAFALPVIQRILSVKAVTEEQKIRTLVLAPSKELCHQLHTNFQELMLKCSRDISSVDLSPQEELSNQKPLLIANPDIIIATPGRILAHIKAGNVDLSQIEIIVIDEADLVFSFGYEKELKEVLKHLPRIYQAVLASATLSEDVLQLKQLVLRNPVILKLQEPEIAPQTQLTHYHLPAEEEEKAVFLYALLKLNLIRGKSIIFVNTVDRCYRIKLYLEQFAIPACVLNSELPAKIRCHSVSQFNQGVYDIIVTSDELTLENPDVNSKDHKKSKRVRDVESGVARGIDFQCVSNVINFDFPRTVTSYIHRAGRTARGKQEGTALSFVSISERPLLDAVERHLRKSFNVGDNDDDDVREDSEHPAHEIIKSYDFKVKEVEGFRYRARDAWKAVTKISIREARLKQIKTEVLNSNKLKVYFEDNPRDLQCLRHDKALHTVKIQPHLAHVPDYIVPESLKRLGLAPKSRKRKAYKPSSVGKAKARFQARQDDPLISLKISKNVKSK